MQEHRMDGEDVLTDRATLQDIARAASDERNAYVALHREGSRVKDRKGREYVVNALGQWVRVGKKRRNADGDMQVPDQEAPDAE